MANDIKTADLILKEAWRIFNANTPFIQSMNRQYDDTYKVQGAKSGDAIRIRRPFQAQIHNQADISGLSGDVNEEEVTLVKSRRKVAKLVIPSTDETFKIDRYSELYIAPAMKQLAAQVEADILNDARLSAPNYVGTFGSALAPSALGAGGAILTDLGCDETDRCAMFSSNQMASLSDSVQGFFHNKEQLDKAFLKGYLGEARGFDCYKSAYVRKHTNPAATGTPQVNGAGQTGNELITDGWTPGTVIPAGTRFTIGTDGADGVYYVNPLTKQQLRNLAVFVTTADVTATGGAATLPIELAIKTSASDETYQNVNQGPADNWAITLQGSVNAVADNGLLYHKNTFAFASVDLERPESAVIARNMQENGIALRYIKDYDGQKDEETTRIDIQYGFKTVMPEWAVAVVSD